MRTHNLSKLITLAAAGLFAASAPALAQDHKVEVTVNAGWTFSDGVTGDSIVGGDGNVYDELVPKSAASLAVTFGVLTTENTEVGFQWAREMSELQAKGTATTKVDDMAVDNYHGYFAYNFGPAAATVRPYVMAGVGATHYSGVSFTTSRGEQRDISGETRFSGTFGGGVKVYPSPNFGVKFGVRWTPTHIRSDAAGWWCDPWWGCYVVGNAQYSNQFEMTGGVAFRF
jgi:opacity protein-like surface antigen